eukprot:CAMPEP_0179405844 /NCGR_PEP_ID=MMETSP0799-20121207/528_1 /TAXON_ID=46947 /ORGANISM="Geminigera cryophila, Strain CCMP2564" /LENGTH=127 /DNA_ID=CAMNT_0021176769 /DNA_START=501 /DNA_END=882 /DNA_ORIENTATION=+
MIAAPKAAGGQFAGQILKPLGLRTFVPPRHFNLQHYPTLLHQSLCGDSGPRVDGRGDAFRDGAVDGARLDLDAELWDGWTAGEICHDLPVLSASGGTATVTEALWGRGAWEQREWERVQGSKVDLRS